MPSYQTHLRSQQCCSMKLYDWLLEHGNWKTQSTDDQFHICGPFILSYINPVHQLVASAQHYHMSKNGVTMFFICTVVKEKHTWRLYSVKIWVIVMKLALSDAHNNYHRISLKNTHTKYPAAENGPHGVI